MIVLWGIAVFFNGATLFTAIFSAMIGPAILFGLIEALCVWRFVVSLERHTDPEYQEEQADKKLRMEAEAVARRQERKAKSEERWQKYADDITPVSAVLICVQDTTGKSVAGTAARMAIGGALFGVFGAAVGMTTAKTKVKGQKAVFSIKYKSGRTGMETVKVGSSRFQQLVAVMHE